MGSMLIPQRNTCPTVQAYESDRLTATQLQARLAWLHIKAEAQVAAQGVHLLLQLGQACLGAALPLLELYSPSSLSMC